MSIAPESLASDTVTARDGATVRDERSPATAHGVKSSKAAVYECSVIGCGRPTATHYCESHGVTCAYCGGEEQVGDLVNNACAQCLRVECEEELERWAGAVCTCGSHKA